MGDVSGLGRRLQDVRGNESLDSFAQRLEVHRNTLFRYEKGESYPDARIIYMLRMKFDVNPDWLITGEGPMHIEDGRTAGYDFELLEKITNILDGLEWVLEKRGREMNFETKKGWIKYLYKQLKQENTAEITRDKVEGVIVEVDELKKQEG